MSVVCVMIYALTAIIVYMIRQQENDNPAAAPGTMVGTHIQRGIKRSGAVPAGGALPPPFFPTFHPL